MGLEPADTGSIRLGPSIRTAYLPQIIHFDHPERSLVDTMIYEKKNMTAQSARNRLAAYEFRGEDVFKQVSSSLRRRALAPAAVHAHGRGGQLSHPRRADEPP